MENQKISIELPVGAWNVVMMALGQRPFAEVVELIGEIRGQADAQISASPLEAAAPTEKAA